MNTDTRRALDTIDQQTSAARDTLDAFRSMLNHAQHLGGMPRDYYVAADAKLDALAGVLRTIDAEAGLVRSSVERES